MIKTVRLLFDYGADIAWCYDTEGHFIDNALPPEWETDAELVDALDELRDRYEALFENSSTVFDYIGFQSLEEESAFRALMNRAIHLVEEKNQGKYLIQNDLEI